VNARIKVGALIVLGSVEGEIEAEDLIEIRSSGSLLGEVITKRIALEEGGVFSGSCTMLD
jgi:cytoskeletal protein CcmA (bactofilin family)